MKGTTPKENVAILALYLHNDVVHGGSLDEPGVVFITCGNERVLEKFLLVYLSLALL